MSRETDPRTREDTSDRESSETVEPTITLFRVALYAIGAALLGRYDYELLVAQFCFGVLLLSGKVAFDYLEGNLE